MVFVGFLQIEGEAPERILPGNGYNIQVA